MIKKHTILLLLFSFYSTSNYGQDTIISTKDTLFLQTKSVQLQSKIIPQTAKDSSKTNFIVQKKYNLPLANSRFNPDSLDKQWMEILYESPLYDSIYETVHSEVFFDDASLPTDLLKRRLAKLDAKTPFNVTYNPSLEQVIKRYLRTRQTTFSKLIGLSKYYYPLFEEKLAKYNIPLEMKHLAIVESALQPKAGSPVGAAGLWQFMFQTGRHFHLDVNSYVDDRYDPVKATEAACQYMAQLYKIYGDWDLVLAAYNSGPGNVNKAIRRSGGYKNYWNIRTNLPRETQGYVPAFLATLYIFEYATEHNIHPRKMTLHRFETDSVYVREMISFDQIAEKTGLPVEEIQYFNPQYKVDIVPKIEGHNYYLVLPTKHIGYFVAHEDEIYSYAKADFAQREKPLPQLFQINDRIRYKVRSGDYLGKIANKFGVHVSQLKKWNGLRSNNLKIGQRLTVYPKRISADAIKPKKTKQAQQVQRVKSKLSLNYLLYTVKEGDTLWDIAQKYDKITIQDILDWNDNCSNGKIKPGMQLKISKL